MKEQQGAFSRFLSVREKPFLRLTEEEKSRREATITRQKEDLWYLTENLVIDSCWYKLDALRTHSPEAILETYVPDPKDTSLPSHTPQLVLAWAFEKGMGGNNRFNQVRLHVARKEDEVLGVAFFGRQKVVVPHAKVAELHEDILDFMVGQPEFVQGVWPKPADKRRISQEINTLDPRLAGRFR
jgi:hypothetical protein